MLLPYRQTTFGSLKIALFCLFILTSCYTSVTKEKLLGSWTTDQDASKYPLNGVKDRLIFFQNDSFKVNMYLNGLLHESFSGTYRLDQKTKMITTRVGTVETHSEIVELNNKTLSLKSGKTKMISHYKRP